MNPFAAVTKLMRSAVCEDFFSRGVKWLMKNWGFANLLNTSYSSDHLALNRLIDFRQGISSGQ